MTPDFDECPPNLWGDDFSIPANPELVAEVAVEDDGPLRDFDTRQDLAGLAGELE